LFEHLTFDYICNPNIIGLEKLLKNYNNMKKLIIILFAIGVLVSCNSKKEETPVEATAPVTLEADVEQALQKNIELNEEVTNLDQELETIINE
jgi:hypothetical protein